VRITRSARKHRVGAERILAAMIDAGEPTVQGDTLRYVGRDQHGVEIEIVAVPDDRRPDTLAVIHAMPTKYRRNR
jgi:hypothetical protein